LKSSSIQNPKSKIQNHMNSPHTIHRRAALKHLGLAVMGGSLLSGHVNAAETLRALGLGQTPDDRRLGPLKDLDGYFPFHPSRSPAEWEPRAQYVRRRLLVAAGLWPFPLTSPLQPVVHGLVDRDDYTVEKVFFESAPGLYVTGNLYRPKGRDGRLAAVLCPHGHWNNGRFFEHSEDAIKKELELGAEKFPVSGRYPLQARCVHLARMGCLVFHYDMLGYADSVPLRAEIAHSMSKQRDNMTAPDHWGMFSAQCELRQINVLGLQTYNSIRALDWISGMPDVDVDRIGVTGASGGGTQTFMLTAVDQQVDAAFPAVMVSTAMQGGCTCENACYLRIETGNIEIAALSAPRPLGMSAANDWTKELETKGLPELKEHYQMLGAADRVEGKYFNFDHNYNFVSRAMMYRFFNKHLKLGADDNLEERDFKPLTIKEMSVWNDEQPKPANDDEAELKMLRAWDANSQKQINDMRPTEKSTWVEYQDSIGKAVDILIGRALPAAGEIEFETTEEKEDQGFLRFAGLLKYAKHGEQLPAAFLHPTNWNGSVVAWIDPQGKRSLFTEDGKLQPTIAKLVAGGTAVASLDVLYTGDFLQDGMPLKETRKVDNPREIAAFTMGYNHPLIAQRTHDVLSMVSFLRNHEQKPKRVILVGIGAAAPWAIAANVQAGAAVDKLAVFTDGFRFATITSIRDPQLWPAALKYGDLPGLLSLCAPRPLWIAGEGASTPKLVATCYAAAGASDAVTTQDGSNEAVLPKLAAWLTA
jgi:dienelactone hydrolase